MLGFGRFDDISEFLRVTIIFRVKRYPKTVTKCGKMRHFMKVVMFNDYFTHKMDKNL